MADETAAPAGSPLAVTPAAPGITVTQDGAVTRVETVTAPTTSEAPPAPAPERPEGLPEGFDSWEAFGKSKLEAPAGEEAPTQEAPAERPAEVQEAIDQLPAEQREKATPFFDEFAREGALSAESKSAAAKAFGVTEGMVDLYIKGAQAAANEAATQAFAPLYEAAGGKETYEAFTAWAQDGGLTGEQIEAFNTALDDPTKAPASVADFVAKWKAAGNGPAPRDIARESGQGSPPAAVAGFASRAQQTAAMSDPRYSNDPAYRAQVEARVIATTAF